VDEPATAPEAAPAYDLDDPSLYLNRELSWLDFNERVFAEALDLRNPLLERVKFLAITASNQDEFFAKRVGWLKRLLASDPRTRTVDGLTVAEQLDLVLARCDDLHRRMEACWTSTLAPELAEHGIRILRHRDLDRAARERMTAYFEQAIFPTLTPLVVDPAHPFPFISSGSLSLALNVRHPVGAADRFARVKVPQNRPRFIDTGDLCFVPIEEVIAAHLDMLYPGMEILDWHPMRVLRSAEVPSAGEEADDLLELIESELRRRRLADPVRLEVGEGLSPERLELLLAELPLAENSVYRSGAMLGLADLAQLAALEIPGLRDEPFTPAVPSAFAATTGDPPAMFQSIAERDVLVHHPYESFDATVARFIDEAAADPSVLAIKQTMYRTSADSPILGSLIEAAGRGKQVAVLVELTARFDEANNIEWARKLEDAGVHVAYGLPSLKIHSKICLVVREEVAGVRMYAHIGTGNYNSHTARVYTDLGLFTADPSICNELVRIFNYLTGYAATIESREILVAPTNLRSELEWRVRREIEAAGRGLPARIVFKMNALEDREFTRLLYEAAAAGVQVDLIIRGICRLRPGLPGLTETVRAVSIIGRFLEHSRVFRFENRGQPEFFIGSADIMKRNLDERIEVLAPVRAPELTRQLDDLLDTLLHDARQGWRLCDSTWSRSPDAEGPGTHALLLSRAPFS
jgi:polyphosphate kinase